MNPKIVTAGQQVQALTASTLAFTVCFTVWTIFPLLASRSRPSLALMIHNLGFWKLSLF